MANPCPKPSISRRHALAGGIVALVAASAPLPALASDDPLVKAIAEFEAHKKAANWKDGDVIGEEIWNLRWEELVEVFDTARPLSMAAAIHGLEYSCRVIDDPYEDLYSYASPIITNCTAFLKANA